ncbi:hypothetical protein EX30DRAFT_134958 [Ascodesmis nigricans]|uniref:Uncharacterized protein n=1 Tax=Ascodesmis nigricans TaxID=341454 RepID=A0A4S2MN72_9PEZI|nr:hypothetical protein EX30DRAFT_134958 [Ascodesmis nigricans]
MHPHASEQISISHHTHRKRTLLLRVDVDGETHERKQARSQGENRKIETKRENAAKQDLVFVSPKKKNKPLGFFSSLSVSQPQHGEIPVLRPMEDHEYVILSDIMPPPNSVPASPDFFSLYRYHIPCLQDGWRSCLTAASTAALPAALSPRLRYMLPNAVSMFQQHRSEIWHWLRSHSLSSWHR